MHTYDEVRKDWETLWAINPAYDMTGGYVDQYDLDKLLKSPTKTIAKECMLDQMRYWFHVGPDVQTSPRKSREKLEHLLRHSPEVVAIKQKYNF